MLHIIRNQLDNITGGLSGIEINQRLYLADIRGSATHILKSGSVDFVVRYMHNFRMTARHLQHQIGQLVDGYFLVTADIKDLPASFLDRQQADHRVNSVTHEGETALLFAIAIYLKGLVQQCSTNKPRDNHPVPAGLAWPYGIKQSDDDD